MSFRVFRSTPILVLVTSGFAIPSLPTLRRDVAAAPVAAPEVASPSEADTFRLDDLLVRMPEAPYKTAYRGVRTYERMFDVGGNPDRLEVRESVLADGAGACRIEVLEVVESELGDPSLVRARMGPRGLFNYHFRDPRVRDVDRVRENYTIDRIEGPARVVGRPCVSLALGANDRSVEFELTVDRKTGLVLSWTELDDRGRVLARASFESLELDPDLGDLAMTRANFDGSELGEPGSWRGDTAGLRRFVEHAPEGFGLSGARSLILPDGSIRYRVTLDDGLRVLTILAGGVTHSGGGVLSSSVDGRQRTLTCAATDSPFTLAGSFSDDRMCAFARGFTVPRR